ncbi:MAG: hypothetical protein HOL31_02075 [Candidatus Scalindua sp.]|jgi:hypothetical protein|nr:hypothetical protein [Candidatus Scalindua sp.]MBT7349689.1 hypothetical protein [candidate division WWE3 bacterium]
MNEIMNYDSFVVWEDGSPRVVYKQMITKEVLDDLPIAALSLPYKRTPKEIMLDEDVEFEGLTNAEVMNIRLARRAAAGEMEAIKTIQDRVLGRPKQSIESKSITQTYTEYLEMVAQEEEELLQEAEIHV